MSAVHRYVVPADGAWHDFYMNGLVLHVAARNEAFAEVWAAYNPDADVWLRQFAVIATGQVLPNEGGWLHAGSGTAPNGYAYHVISRRSQGKESTFVHPEIVREHNLNVGEASDF